MTRIGGRIGWWYKRVTALEREGEIPFLLWPSVFPYSSPPPLRASPFGTGVLRRDGEGQDEETEEGKEGVELQGRAPAGLELG